MDAEKNKQIIEKNKRKVEEDKKKKKLENGIKKSEDEIKSKKLKKENDSWRTIEDNKYQWRKMWGYKRPTYKSGVLGCFSEEWPRGIKKYCVSYRNRYLIWVITKFLNSYLGILLFISYLFLND